MRRGTTWGKPEPVCRVEYANRMPSGTLCNATFKGLREDIPANEVKPEQPMATPTKKKSSGLESITHPDRVVFPESGITKLALATYFQRAAERLLPHIVGRPLSLVRCPVGIGGHCFYQKHVVGRFPQGVELVDVGEGRDKLYPVVGNEAGLLALAQMSAIEVHPWGSTFRHLDVPDRLIFDLDPGPDVAWAAVVMAAKIVRQRLREFGLESFVKTSGGKGLHVTVPIRPEHDWKVAKEFCRNVAAGLAKEAPDAFVATATKVKRTGRIYVDYLRNARGATAVAPYSPRAREPAPIAMPITWRQLERIDSPVVATLGNAEKWLRGTDPWQGFGKVAQRLSKAALKQAAAQK